MIHSIPISGRPVIALKSPMFLSGFPPLGSSRPTPRCLGRGSQDDFTIHLSKRRRCHHRGTHKRISYYYSIIGLLVLSSQKEVKVRVLARSNVSRENVLGPFGKPYTLGSLITSHPTRQIRPVADSVAFVRFRIAGLEL